MSQAVRQSNAPHPIRDAGPGPRQTGSDEQKRSFLRVVSHELRTPLNSILGFSEILASELYGPLGCDQYREYAQIIRSSGENLLKLVNQVMEIVRLETGDTEIQLQPERLGPILEAVRDGLADALTARSLRLVVEPCCDTEMLADARALRTVLSHLLQNAVTFSPEGGLITVSSRLIRHRFEIVVRNEGEGVDPADLARLARPFEQGENALTRRGEGAGLGLTICELACHAMGGRLKLVSDRGQGFAAHVLLSLA